MSGSADVLKKGGRQYTLAAQNEVRLKMAPDFKKASASILTGRLMVWLKFSFRFKNRSFKLKPVVL